MLEPIEDFARVKEVLAKVPNVKQVVPMGIDQAMVATGNVIDIALERLRADVRRLEEGGGRPSVEAAVPGPHGPRAPDRQLLEEDLSQRAPSPTCRAATPSERQGGVGRPDPRRLRRVLGGLRPGPVGALEFLENRIAKLSMDGAFTFLRYVGTDLDAFSRPSRWPRWPRAR